MKILRSISEWDRIPAAAVDLVTSHEVLYLEPDLHDFMRRVHRILALDGNAYIVLGCHSENPLWPSWKTAMVEAGCRVYDYMPL